MPEREGWVKTFDEEFTDATIDSSKWTTIYFGFNANSVKVGGGQAVLHLDSDPASSPPWEPGGHVAALNTIGLFSQKYGWFEIRAKVATGAGLRGITNAFWLVPVDGSYNRSVEQGGVRPLAEPFEIDIFEQMSDDPKVNTHSVHAGNNADFASSRPGPENTRLDHRVENGRDPLPTPFSDGFHRFALLWTPAKLTWFLDGQESHSVSPPPNAPFAILLNLYRHAGADAVMPFANEFIINYVRVYALPSNAKP